MRPDVILFQILIKCPQRPWKHGHATESRERKPNDETREEMTRSPLRGAENSLLGKDLLKKLGAGLGIEQFICFSVGIPERGPGQHDWFAHIHLQTWPLNESCLAQSLKKWTNQQARKNEVTNMGWNSRSGTASRGWSILKTICERIRKGKKARKRIDTDKAAKEKEMAIHRIAPYKAL